MKTQLSYLGSWNDSSSVGTKRYLLLLIPTTISVYIINMTMFPGISKTRNLITSFFISIWLASVLGVQNSVSLVPTVSYGALSFFVIYVCIATSLWLTEMYKIKELILPVILGTVFGALNGLFIYNVGPTFNYLM